MSSNGIETTSEPVEYTDLEADLEPLIVVGVSRNI